MFPSIFTDELGVDILEGLPILRSWGLEHVDLRGRVMGHAAEALPPEKLPELKELLQEYGMQVGCLESSLAKVHLPDAERRAAEAEKLEGIIRAADALDCRLVRAFFYWQPPREQRGQLTVRPDELQKVLDMFGPLAERAQEAGLTLAFENCGVTPEEVITVVDALGIPQWGLAWDCMNSWNTPQREEHEDAYIRRMAQHTRVLHVKGKGVVPGVVDTEIPYEKVLHACHNAGLQGPVSVETHLAEDKVENSKTVLDAIRRAWPSAAPGGLEAARPKREVSRSYEHDPVGFGVVGLGMGHHRAGQVVKTPGARLVAVCDLREERAKRSAEAYDVPWTQDYTDFFDNDEIEVVYVLTETGNHGTVAMDALHAGKHAMTTKPMEASLDAARRMVRVADEAGRLLGVDFGRRFRDDTWQLKEAIGSGWFGDLLGGTCMLKVQRTMDYFEANGGWRGTWALDGGGVMSNQNIHLLDHLAFTVGIPRRVRCNIRTQAHEIEAEDLGLAAWEYENGAVIQFAGTTSYPQPTWYVAMELWGSEGAWSHFSGGPFEEPMNRWFKDGAWMDRAPNDTTSPWLNAADNFAAAVRTGADLAATGRNGARSQAILQAMYDSARENGGDWVEVATD